MNCNVMNIAIEINKLPMFFDQWRRSTLRSENQTRLVVRSSPPPSTLPTLSSRKRAVQSGWKCRTLCSAAMATSFRSCLRQPWCRLQPAAPLSCLRGWNAHRCLRTSGTRRVLGGSALRALGSRVTTTPSAGPIAWRERSETPTPSLPPSRRQLERAQRDSSAQPSALTSRHDVRLPAAASDLVSEGRAFESLWRQLASAE